MRCQFENLEVAGVAAALPPDSLDLRSLSPLFGSAEVERIIAGTGIQVVRTAPEGMTTADLCEAAARPLLAELGLGAPEVDGLVFVSQTPDYVMPATSVALQDRLGLSTEIPAFDLPYGCSGYIYGLFQAALLIQAGACRTVLVCAGDTLARFVHPRDRALRMVFGDAGSATVVRRGAGRAGFALHSDGSGARHLIVPAGGCRTPRSDATSVAQADASGNQRSPENVFMDGAEIMNFALRRVPQVLDEILTLAGWERTQVGLFALHQANRFMVDYLAKKCRLPKGTTPVGMSQTGNTGPASIPLLLAGERAAFPPAQRVRSVLCGFGVGLSWGACALDLSATRILAPVECPSRAVTALP